MILLIPALFAHASALPLVLRQSTANQTDNADPSWMEAPKGRGTFNLILSCLTTLGLCAWTAFHPNVPPKHNLVRSSSRRLLWMLVAIFVPEVVLYCAWEQWWIAKQLRKDINELGDRAVNGVGSTGDPTCDLCGCAAFVSCRDDEPTPEGETNPSPLENPTEGKSNCDNAESTPEMGATSQGKVTTGDTPKTSTYLPADRTLTPWTMRQAFFAVCGGIAVRSSVISKETLFFTPAGILELAKAGILPIISDETVADKSKANLIAKVLVCVQAGWFFVQSIARIASRLPLTLLEIHVLTHVVCALFMYFLWLEKPYEAESALYCEDERVIDMAALFALNAPKWTRKERSYDSEKCCQLEKVNLSEVKGINRKPPPHQKRLGCIRRFWKSCKDGTMPDWVLPRYSKHPVPPDDSWYSEAMLEHLQRANRAIQHLKEIGSHFRWTSKADAYWLGDEDEDAVLEIHVRRAVALKFDRSLVVTQRDNLVVQGTKYEKGNWKMGPRLKFYFAQATTLSVAGALYGGAHLMAWAKHFPSRTEMWLWRASALTIATVPFCVALGMAIVYSTYWIDTRGKHSPTWVVWGTICLCTFPVFAASVGAYLYPVARVYLLVESFASLRSPPWKTYQTVQWPNIILHAG